MRGLCVLAGKIVRSRSRWANPSTGTSRLDDPHGLFNASLDGKARRAIDLKQSDSLDEQAFLHEKAGLSIFWAVGFGSGGLLIYILHVFLTIRRNRPSMAAAKIIH